MPAHLSADDAAQPPPDWGLMLRRGMIRRCPRCGGRNLFRNWLSIKDRCPSCGLRFAREEGYFTGVYLLNLGAVLVALFVLVMAFALWRGSHPDANLVPFLVACAVVSVVLPIAFYPFARTLWSAIDLVSTPMEVEEILDAAEASDADDADSSPGGSASGD